MKREDDESLETLFKLRLEVDRVKFLRELGWLIVFLIGWAIGMASLGAFQFWECRKKNPDIEFLQCLRHDNLKIRKQ